MHWWPPLPRQNYPRRLVLIMAVKDEVDILPHTLEFHFARGVDFALVADNGSADGTCDVLERFRQEGRLAWEREPDPGYHQSAWMTRLALRARDQYHADWLLCCDADEFWCPRGGTLKEVIARQSAPVLRCPRQNEVRTLPSKALSPSHESPFLNQIYTPVLRPRRWQTPCAERSFQELSDPAVPGISFHAESPKVLARADRVIAVKQGNHDVQTNRWTWRSEPNELLIRHFPVRTPKQFAAKVLTGGAAYARTQFPPQVGWHWRHWYALAQRGELLEAYARETVCADLPPPTGCILGSPRSAALALDLPTPTT